MDHPYIITSSHSINHLTPPRSRLLQDPTESFNPIPSPTKTLLSSIRTATASTLAYVAANSTAAKAMHLIKVFQKIIFDRENTIALLTVSNKSANTRISSLASENEELKSKMENMAMQMKVLTQALQLQLEPKMVKNEVMRGKSERGMRRPSSFGGVGSARFSRLGIDDESVEPALARVVESRARAELSFVEPSSCTIDLQPEFAGLAMTSVIEEVEGTKTVGTKNVTELEKKFVLNAKKIVSKREKRHDDQSTTTLQHEIRSIASSSSFTDSNIILTPHSVTSNSQDCRVLPTTTFEPDTNLPVINTLIKTVQKRDKTIKGQASRIAELVKQLAVSEGNVCHLMRKHDEEYLEKIKLWSALCETEMGLRRLDSEVGERLRAGWKKKVEDGSDILTEF
ncbi:hypothetical protein L207DRAFT_590761 [Hyaloscypha variabilis F]|uniref:Uncharacterized protein n=1 Tax=Hyaloscypha variabilis (strain UAMH 11265 / GT02V1 / F) TaxID=1149755 RepID=A0A2J6R1S1_HYAVF|nr:hypothetical protein L207DRAFT_590761 [Hyaloscypha variabilis F]